MPRCTAFFLIFAMLAAMPAVASDDPPVPDPIELMTLVRTTVLAVDTGNKTGSYQTLWAMGNPAFQQANPAEKLRQDFAKLRATGLDLEPVRTLVPLTTRAPTVDRNGLLRILGFFELPSWFTMFCTPTTAPNTAGG